MPFVTSVSVLRSISTVSLSCIYTIDILDIIRPIHNYNQQCLNRCKVEKVLTDLQSKGQCPHADTPREPRHSFWTSPLKSQMEKSVYWKCHARQEKKLFCRHTFTLNFSKCFLMATWWHGITLWTVFDLVETLSRVFCLLSFSPYNFSKSWPKKETVFIRQDQNTYVHYEHKIP